MSYILPTICFMLMVLAIPSILFILTDDDI